MITRNLLALSAAILLATGWTSLAQAKDGAASGDSRRGEAFAREACGQCHGLGKALSSPNAAAPPFRTIAMKYESLRIDWELETISEVGHYAMPGKRLDRKQVQDLTAYIRSVAPHHR